MLPTGKFPKRSAKSYQPLNVSKIRYHNSLGFSKTFYPTTEEDYEWTARRHVSFSLLSPHNQTTTKRLPQPLKVAHPSVTRPVRTRKLTIRKGLKLLTELCGPVPTINKKAAEKPKEVKVDESLNAQLKTVQKEHSATLLDLSAFEATSKRAIRRGSMQLLKGQMFVPVPPLKATKIEAVNTSSESDSFDSVSMSSDEDQRPIPSLSANSQNFKLQKSQTSVLPILRLRKSSQQISSSVIRT